MRQRPSAAVRNEAYSRTASENRLSRFTPPISRLNRNCRTRRISNCPGAHGGKESATSAKSRYLKNGARAAVESDLDGGSWKLVAEFTEIESGKRSERPKLADFCCRIPH